VPGVDYQIDCPECGATCTVISRPDGRVAVIQ